MNSLGLIFLSVLAKTERLNLQTHLKKTDSNFALIVGKNWLSKYNGGE